ncbi:MAG: EAL domain-containing protein [Rubrivivax sp.]|jgi:diguanylate cyclase (GGDEF)-like protein|nr:EAL domain-containing protein [Rubrivivax sp.]
MGVSDAWLRQPALEAPPAGEARPPVGATSAELAAFIESLPQAAWLVDGATRQVMCANAIAHRLLGRTEHSMVGEAAENLVFTPEDLAYWDEASAGHAGVLDSETWLSLPDGQARRVSRSIRPFAWWPSPSGEGPSATRTAYTVVITDIGERQQAEERLEQALAELQATLESTADGLLVTDLAGRIRTYNQRFVQLWKLPPGLMERRDYRAMNECMREQVSEPERYELRLRELVNAITLSATDQLELRGHQLVERATQPLWHRGTPMGRVYAFRDMTERVAASRRIAELASTDALTGLPNRTLLTRAVADAAANCEARGEASPGFALMLIDLDRFGAINETLGAELADVVLVQVTRRLQNVLRHGDLVARVGGDQFALLIHGAEPEDAEVAAQRIVKAISEPMQIEDLPFTLTCSVGVAVSPLHGNGVDELQHSAEEAMRQAKAAGRNGWRMRRLRRSSDPRLALRMDHAMRQALDSESFRLHYQPQIDMVTGAIVGAEALLRWRDPQFGGDVPPARFIPVAEESGLIVALGNWVMDRAIQQSAQWLRAGVCVPVAVNVSALQFHQPGFSELVADMLARHGLHPRWLELEVTESILLQDADETLQRLNALADLGVRLSIDDFGTGYSSLAYLKRIPIDQVKIDRSFVVGLPGDRSNAGIVKAILQLAQALGKEVIAEGVESPQQHRFLRDAGCARFQGFLYAPAMDAVQFEQRWRAGVTTEGGPRD